MDSSVKYESDLKMCRGYFKKILILLGDWKCCLSLISANTLLWEKQWPNRSDIGDSFQNQDIKCKSSAHKCRQISIMRKCCFKKSEPNCKCRVLTEFHQDNLNLCQKPLKNYMLMGTPWNNIIVMRILLHGPLSELAISFKVYIILALNLTVYYGE